MNNKPTEPQAQLPPCPIQFLIIEPHADGSVYIVNPDPLLCDPVNEMDAVIAKCGSLDEARTEARRLTAIATTRQIDAATSPTLAQTTHYETFQAGWSAGFQEAQEPDRFPHQNRCEVRYRELFPLASPLPSEGVEPQREATPQPYSQGTWLNHEAVKGSARRAAVRVVEEKFADDAPFEVRRERVASIIESELKG